MTEKDPSKCPAHDVDLQMITGKCNKKLMTMRNILKQDGSGQYTKGKYPANKIVLPKDELIELSKKYGSTTIAKYYGVAPLTVRRNMDEYGIEKRGVPKKLPEYWRKALHKPKSVPAWSKGLTKENDERIMQLSESLRGDKNPMWKSELHTGEMVEMVECACGCGEMIHKYDNRGRRRYWCVGHCNTGYFEAGYTPWNTGKKMPESSIQRGEYASGYKDGKTMISNFCVDCGKEIKYDSVRCPGCAHKGEFNSGWLGGRSFEKYGKNFTKELKEKIRERDNYTCQECGFTQVDLGYTLSIHHIDYNKKNNTPNNLISLCKSCHQQTNFRRDDWINYFQNKIGGIIND